MGAVQGKIAVDGGNVGIVFTAGSILAITLGAGENQGVNIAECLPTSLPVGGAVNKWLDALMSEASSTPGSHALRMEVTTEANSSTTIYVPGCNDPYEQIPPQTPDGPRVVIRLIYKILNP